VEGAFGGKFFVPGKLSKILQSPQWPYLSLATKHASEPTPSSLQLQDVLHEALPAPSFAVSFNTEALSPLPKWDEYAWN
jgi:hypothetical protein